MTDSYDGPPQTPPAERASFPDGLRFAFGTLTVLPARITRWDRPAARTGMACAPLAGLVVGVLAALPGAIVLLLGGGPLLAAALTVAVPAALTRGLHLDGLADTADGLGSAKPADEALRIMKQSDIGPFGVVALVIVLLLQAAALSDIYADSWIRGALAAVVAAVAARLAMTLACREGVPAARPGGLGAAVAGVVPRRAAALIAVLTVALAAAAALPLGLPAAGRSAAAVLAALLAAELLLRRCVRRFDGVTGDVFGALAEVAATTALIVLALG
ncbi:adenosylcobinamide-GDP ribazoletransferase [Streptomyces nojiriensis]|uniref:Adenosylcobinamide-GDP ribazoletransferase n=1 Tax=Streptomyces nojiriensis TaxID=66374 RepID=A0ABQ3STQ5_9ACTN|nr:adenosylcobinamide-GDP ribazoletransferase [Streptomyces nojiriensis]QTI45062.1 Adenosylcobinamide-GDP ribazoletransferase [Streptomyces nojiriensis]GGR93394.1 adenosylcobinamide-GDP ribazoletransferase [Streptomyces nojiriensis]GHI71516.1 adenosylcobinamide-GDP ribazoletransferase [Streptomyces nojiriensis]